jgi:hypothetical protein
MNTSFGPRIDENRWDFHDGIDLPARRGTKIHAMHGGTVRHAGEPNTGGYSSRHVVIRVTNPPAEPLYNVYLHLDSIDPAVVTDAPVIQDQLIGTVGRDDATYSHLHMEFRKGTYRQIGSVHPLTYLPYVDSANFSAPTADRFNRLDAFMAARLLFGASSKLEGDLKRVEVDLRRGNRLLTTRFVDFDDKQTVSEEEDDRFVYVDGIGVEGYQKSNMVRHGRDDLEYGILVRGIPNACNTLVARVIDLAGNVSTSSPIAVPTNHKAVDKFVDFETGQLPPPGWSQVTGAPGTAVTIAATAAHSGTKGMRCVDNSSSGPSEQSVGIEATLADGRFEWRAEAWFKPTELGIAPGQSVALLQLFGDTELIAAARICNDGGTLRAGLMARRPDNTENVRLGPPIGVGGWRKWRLEVLRAATRETTVILYLDDAGRMREQLRRNWDSAAHPPTKLLVGLATTSAASTATVLVDEVWLTESELSS